MHEMSLMYSVIEIATEALSHEQFNKVVTVRLGVGLLSGAQPDALTFCYDEVARGTVLEGSHLVLEEIPVRVLCSECARESGAKPDDLSCPLCHASQTKIMSGTELKLIDLEVQ